MPEPQVVSILSFAMETRAKMQELVIHEKVEGKATQSDSLASHVESTGIEYQGGRGKT